MKYKEFRVFSGDVILRSDQFLGSVVCIPVGLLLVLYLLTLNE